MTPQTSTKKGESTEQAKVGPVNAVQVKKAVAHGKELSKKEEATKADVARAMYEMIQDESREVIVQAFIDGANLTPKGAQTYYYNCKRKMKKGS